MHFLTIHEKGEPAPPQHITAEGFSTADSFSGLFYWCGSYTRRNKLKNNQKNPYQPNKKNKIVFCSLCLETLYIVLFFFFFAYVDDDSTIFSPF